jgi:hypothetical protein
MVAGTLIAPWRVRFACSIFVFIFVFGVYVCNSANEADGINKVFCNTVATDCATSLPHQASTFSDCYYHWLKLFD